MRMYCYLLYNCTGWECTAIYYITVQDENVHLREEVEGLHRKFEALKVTIMVLNKL